MPNSISLLLDSETFDAVIIGTGLVESILSAALSISGSRVLHLDRNSFYGAQDATLTCQQIEELFSRNEELKTLGPDEKCEETEVAAKRHSIFGPSARKLPVQVDDICQWRQSHDFRWTRSDGHEPPEKVFIDLIPRPLFAAGTLVDLMIQTDIGHHVNFRPLSASFLYFPPNDVDQEKSSCRGVLQEVPASRSDIFQNRFLTVIEKRLLMRYFSALAPSDDGNGSMAAANTANRDLSFEEHMENAGLTPKLTILLINAIISSDTTAASCVERGSTISYERGRSVLHKYLKSISRYGTTTPFLYPNYGSGELCEAFCRLSAVHGATFALRRRVTGVYYNCAASASDSDGARSATCGIVTSEGEAICTRHVFVSMAAVSPNTIQRHVSGLGTSSTWRFVGVLEGSVFSESTDRALAFFPKNSFLNQGAAVRVLQVDSSTHVCTDGRCILYAETMGPDGDETDLGAVVEWLLAGGCENTNQNNGTSSTDAASNRPHLVWSLMYRAAATSRHEFDVKENELGALGCCIIRNVDTDLDGTEIVSEVKRCFKKVRPISDFFLQQEKTTD